MSRTTDRPVTPPQYSPPPPQYPSYPPQYSQQPPQNPGYPPMQPQQPKKKRGGFLKWVAIGAAALIVLLIIASAASGGSQSSATATPANQSSATTAPTLASIAQQTVVPPTAASANQRSATTIPTAAAKVQPTVAPTTAVKAKVGDRVQSKTLGVTVNQVVDPAPTDSFNTPKDGFRFVAVDFTIENLDTKAQSYNALYATVKDTDGRQYDITFFNPETPALSAGDNAPSDKIRGWVTFEVPVGATLATFKYEPVLSGMQVLIDISK